MNTGTRRDDCAHPLGFTVAALGVLLAVHAWAVHTDLAQEERDAARLNRAAWPADLALSRDLAQRVAAAYAQGQRDAMEALHGQPQGVALAQACLALPGVQP